MNSFNDEYWTFDKLNILNDFMGGSCSILKKVSGGNSNVYKLDFNGRFYAIKVYPPYTPRGRNRLLSEATTYQFFSELELDMVPHLYKFNETQGWLVIDWLDGEILLNYSNKDIDASLKFIELMQSLKDTKYSNKLPDAAESCTSIEQILSLIDERLNRLIQQKNQDACLLNFLQKDFMNQYSFYREKTLEQYKNLGMSYDIPKAHLTLIPADFGFHNMIKTNNDKLYFIDFDYFGWDDPVRLLSDILWHPKMSFNKQQRQQYIDGFIRIFNNDKIFQKRFELNFPIFCLRWVLILLNEFIPDYWKNRVHSGVKISHEEAKKKQLLKARKLLEQIKTGCLYE